MPLKRDRKQPRLRGMIEITWGKPLTFDAASHGGNYKISTIEQAKYWLRKRWPVADKAREHALIAIEDAMDCLAPVEMARSAFAVAARSAGFRNITIAG